MANIDDIDLEEKEVEETKEAIPVPQKSFSLPSWLTAKTGDGPIEDYINHPLNFGDSKEFAQILRGLTGIVGDMKIAIIDIIVGGLKFAKKRSNPHA